MPVLLIGCCFFANAIRAQQVEKIYINPKNPAIQKQTSFVDSIKFTPFESVAGINFNEYANVRLTEHYFLVTDYGTGFLYIYTKTGAFVKKINFKSLANNLYPAYNAKTNEVVFFGNNSNYTLTSKDRVKIQLDWSNERNLKYFKKYVIDLSDTAFVIKNVKPGKYNLIGAYAFYADQYMQTKITTSPLYKDSTGYEVNVYENEKLVKSYFPYNRVTEPKFLFSEENVSIAISDTPYISYLTRPYCDTVYKLVKGSLSPVYQLVMPLENSLPATFFTDASVTKTERENFKRNNGWAFHQVHDFYETSKLIYITISFFSHYEVFVYDKQTHTAYNATKIKGDPQQYNLSLLTSYNVMRSGHKFYKLLKADALVSFFRQNPDITVPKELSAFLQGNPDKNMPVVVEFTFKD
ncbi:MAG: 6-bladed beta-propeller [Bacteroidota bacterium]